MKKEAWGNYVCRNNIIDLNSVTQPNDLTDQRHFPDAEGRDIDDKKINKSQFVELLR